jgi:mannose-6-phosphate isomerase-like protein (cupin superfamily)
MRRVVTGHDAQGRAVFISDQQAPRHIDNPAGGLSITELWGNEATPRIPVAHDDPTLKAHPYFPAPTGSRFVLVRWPSPAAAAAAVAGGVDVQAAAAAFLAQLPGLGEVMEPDHPGMHASQSVDYGYIIAGEIDLELDGGVKKRLRAGDCFVQNGTRHAWQNPGPTECVMLAVVTGANRA